jgi:hypothetical protein
MNNIKGIKETEFWFKQLDEARNADKRSKLTEAPVSTTEKANAAKRFRAAVKAQERHGLLPVDDFHTAFDDELHALLDDATYESLFNADGTLKHRGTYGIIKKLDQTNPVVKALVKFWALQFSLDQMLPDAKAAWDKEAADREASAAAYEAERKAKEEENKKAFDLKVKDLQVEADKEAEEHFKKINNLIDPELIERSKQDSTFVPFKLKAEVHGQFDSRSSVEDQKISVYFYLTVGDSTWSCKRKDFNDKNLNRFVDIINNRNKAISRYEMIKANGKWYSDEFEALLHKTSNHNHWLELVFQGSGKVFKLQANYGDGYRGSVETQLLNWLQETDISEDAILVGVSYHASSPATYTFQDGHSTTYDSVASNISKEAAAELRVWLDPTKFVDDDNWGESSYHEVTSPTSNHYKSGMSRWFISEHTSYATD